MKHYVCGFLLVALATVAAQPAQAQTSYNFLGEIRFVPFNFAPQGWAQCNGQIMPINQNTALFALIGTYYGGDGITTFALPNLQGRVPLATGNGHNLAETGGQENVTLTIAQMPKHHHDLKASSATADSSSPAGEGLANHKIYNTQKPDVRLKPSAMTDVGGSQPVSTMPPYLGLTCIIALSGIFPSRN
ncbi:MAG: tail fiber protein [Terriglobales bacterium]